MVQHFSGNKLLPDVVQRGCNTHCLLFLIQSTVQMCLSVKYVLDIHVGSIWESISKICLELSFYKQKNCLGRPIN